MGDEVVIKKGRRKVSVKSDAHPHHTPDVVNVAKAADHARPPEPK